MSRIALLDVNLLVALFDPEHIHHETAHDWFADHRAEGWATCPISQSGFMRILANPAYGPVVMRAVDLAARLRQFCASPDHVFWSATPSFLDADLFNLEFVRGHRQLTDVYLLAIAVQNRGRLVTFDRTILFSAVKGATRDSLAVIAPVSEEIRER